MCAGWCSCSPFIGKECQVQKGWGCLPKVTHCLVVKPEPDWRFFDSLWALLAGSLIPGPPLPELSAPAMAPHPCYTSALNVWINRTWGASAKEVPALGWMLRSYQSQEELGWRTSHAGVGISQKTINHAAGRSSALFWFPVSAEGSFRTGTSSTPLTVPPFCLPLPCPLLWEKLSRGFWCFLWLVKDDQSIPLKEGSFQSSSNEFSRARLFQPTLLEISKCWLLLFGPQDALNAENCNLFA